MAIGLSFMTRRLSGQNLLREVCEMVLAHTIMDKTEAAYRRDDLFEERRQHIDT